MLVAFAVVGSLQAQEPARDPNAAAAVINRVAKDAGWNTINSVRVSIEQEEILWTEIQLTTIKAEIKEFKELLIFIHNPYRNDFNLLYGLYLAKIGVIPVPQGDFQYNLTDNQLDGLAQAACLPKDILRAWPKSPKQKNGTLAKWLC